MSSICFCHQEFINEEYVTIHSPRCIRVKMLDEANKRSEFGTFDPSWEPARKKRTAGRRAHDGPLDEFPGYKRRKVTSTVTSASEMNERAIAEVLPID